MATIHNTAIVHRQAHVDKDVVIGPYCTVHEDVVINEGCELVSHVVVEGPCVIGRNNKIFPFACIGLAPQDLKYNGEKTKLIIGDYNQIRESCNIHRGTWQGGGKTEIGNHNLLMSLVHIGHDCTIGNHTVISSHSGLAGHVLVQDKVIVGGMVGISQFIRVGRNSYIAGYSRIDRDVPPFSICMGLDELCIRGVNIVGLKREGMSYERIQLLMRVFDILFTSDKPLLERVRDIDQTMIEDPAVSYVVDFIKTSTKGLINRLV